MFLIWEKVPIWEKVLFLGSGGFCILGINSSITIGIFVYNFRKKFSDLRNVSSGFLAKKT